MSIDQGLERKGKRELLLNSDRISIWNYEKILGIDSGDSCTIS